MARTNAAAEAVVATRLEADMPESKHRRRHAAEADAAQHLDRDPARLGAELAGENRPRDETETADAIKRAAENDGRV